jgi:acyl carrier protein phosphodiesterase
MNYLGHIFLADDTDESRIGQYLGDFVKGCEAELRKKYSSTVVEGILTHRQLDLFTDMHHSVRRAIKLLRPASGRYAPIIVDVMFDYFLIKHWNKFSDMDFQDFVSISYGSLEQIVASDIYPERCRNFTRKLIDRDAFNVYSTLDGIQQVLNGIDRRLKRPSTLPDSHICIQSEYLKLEQCFLDFFTDLTKESASPEIAI